MIAKSAAFCWHDKTRQGCQRASKSGSRAMPRTFKQWTPATAELELLHECWLARLPPARIAVMSQFESLLPTPLR